MPALFILRPTYKDGRARETDSCGGGVEGERAWVKVVHQTPCLAFRLTLEWEMPCSVRSKDVYVDVDQQKPNDHPEGHSEVTQSLSRGSP